jgi:CubicO group peptidase (beta-lactamase class C family)
MRSWFGVRAAVLQLVERGVVKLDDPVTLHVDPLLKRLNGTTLADHFGAEISKVLITHLLHMTSGLGDYDRGSYSADQFASPAHDFSPIEILGKYVPQQVLQAACNGQQRAAHPTTICNRPRHVCASASTPAVPMIWQ